MRPPDQDAQMLVNATMNGTAFFGGRSYLSGFEYFSKQIGLVACYSTATWGLQHYQLPSNVSTTGDGHTPSKVMSNSTHTARDLLTGNNVFKYR